MDYPVTDWHGHPNHHCPFCSFATTSPNATELIDAHVAAVHPTAVREAVAAEMTAQLQAARKAMNKEQLLELAKSFGIEGLSMKNTRDEIEAAIAASETETAAAALAAPEDE